MRFAWDKHAFKATPRSPDQPVRPPAAKTTDMRFRVQLAGQTGPCLRTPERCFGILAGSKSTPRTAPVPLRYQLGLPQRRLAAPLALPRRQLNVGLVRRRTNFQLID